MSQGFSGTLCVTGGDELPFHTGQQSGASAPQRCPQTVPLESGPPGDPYTRSDYIRAKHFLPARLRLSFNVSFLT